MLLLFALRLRLFDWHPVQKAIQLLLRKGVLRIFCSARLSVGNTAEFTRSPHDMRGKKHDQLGFGAALLLASEQGAESGNIAEKWDLTVGRRLVVLHQSTNHDTLPVWRDDHCVGRSGIND